MKRINKYVVISFKFLSFKYIILIHFKKKLKIKIKINFDFNRFLYIQYNSDTTNLLSDQGPIGGDVLSMLEGQTMTSYGNSNGNSNSAFNNNNGEANNSIFKTSR